MLTATFAAVVRRDLLLAARQRADVANTLLFFIVVVTMVPLGVGPEINTLRTIAPGVVWVAALLASILSLNRLFGADYADGTLEQMLLSGEPLPVIVLAKVLAHWLTTGLPITLMAVLLGVMFDLPADAIAVLVASLVLGTPALSLIGAVGAALTLGLRGGGVLITLLVLPLYVPSLVPARSRPSPAAWPRAVRCCCSPRCPSGQPFWRRGQSARHCGFLWNNRGLTVVCGGSRQAAPGKVRAVGPCGNANPAALSFIHCPPTCRASLPARGSASSVMRRRTCFIRSRGAWCRSLRYWPPC